MWKKTWLCDKNLQGIILRSKCDWYKHREKSLAFFLKSWENTCNTKPNGFIKSWWGEAKEKGKNNDELNQFYKNLFSKNINSNQKVVNYLKNIDTHKLLQWAKRKMGDWVVKWSWRSSKKNGKQ